MNSWRSLLLDAVAPFDSGVRGLNIYGTGPDPEQDGPNRRAAVLVPVLDTPDPEVVLTVRAAHLAQHSGQVAFPGGGMESDDSSAVETALREAEEETGLPRKAAHPIGFLDRLDTVSDYRVLPIVALIDPPVAWRPDHNEVDEVFTVPASVIFDRNSYRSEPFERDGRVYRVWTLDWEGRRIWGITAAILMNLVIRLEKARERQNTAVG